MTTKYTTMRTVIALPCGGYDVIRGAHPREGTVYACPDTEHWAFWMDADAVRYHGRAQNDDDDDDRYDDDDDDDDDGDGDGDDET